MTRKYPLRTIACNLGCIRYTVSVVDVQMFHGNKQIKKKKKKKFFAGEGTGRHNVMEPQGELFHTNTFLF
jgi:hypothetical protein